MMYGKRLFVFAALSLASLPAFGAESKVEFSFSAEASKVFTETLLRSHADISEVSAINVDPAVALESSVCTAFVLKSNWGDDITESFDPESRIECAVKQSGKEGVVFLDLSKTAVHRFGNRTMHKKSFAIKGDLSRALLKALIATKEAEPNNDMLRVTKGTFATQVDQMISATIRMSKTEELSGIDCFVFITYKNGEWVSDGSEMCSFVTKEW